MNTQLTGALRRGAVVLTASAMVAAGLVAGGSLAGPAEAAHAADEATVSDASLTWGVKESFRNYIYDFDMFEGTSTLLGSTTQEGDDGSYTWHGGVGTAAESGQAADVDFGDGNGVHFQSHPMDDGYALDLQFLDPHIVVDSASSAQLRFDVIGHEYVDTTTVGPEYSLEDVTVATLDLSAGQADVGDDELSVAGAPATLTESGAKAFGGF